MDKLTLIRLGEFTTNFYQKVLDDSGFKYTTHKWDFKTINEFLPNQFKRIIELVKKELLTTPPNKLIIPNITLHETLDKLNLNLIHPLERLVNHLKNNNLNQATLFATKYTMEHNYVSKYLSNHGIEIHIPSALDREVIDALRLNIYSKGTSKESEEVLSKQILTYTQLNRPVVLACTELSVVYNELSIANTLDLSKIQLGYSTIIH